MKNKRNGINVAIFAMAMSLPFWLAVAWLWFHNGLR